MLLPPNTLIPPNPEAVGVLPSSASAVSDQPGLPEVRKVYPQAIEVSDMMSITSGAFLLMGCLFFPTGVVAAVVFLPMILAEGSYAFAVFVLLGLSLPTIGGLFFIRIDTAGYRCEPVMFNRGGAGGRGTVHHFWGGRVSLKPGKPLTHSVRSYRWDCVRAEITTAVVGTAPHVRRECFLTLAITQAPGSNQVIDRFKVGMANTPQGIADFWEHLRRYMQENGPAVSAKTEQLDPRDLMPPLWRSLFSWQPFFGPDAHEFSGVPMWLRVPLAVVMMVVLGAFSVPFGFCRWLSLRLKAEPRWPAAVLASAGGAALTRRQMAQRGQPSSVSPAGMVKPALPKNPAKP